IAAPAPATAIAVVAIAPSMIGRAQRRRPGKVPGGSFGARADRSIIDPCRARRQGTGKRSIGMKSILAVVGDGNASAVLATALSVARTFQSHIVGLHAVTTEYAVVFGGEMGFSISSEVDRTLEREGQERRDQARRVFREVMAA